MCVRVEALAVRSLAIEEYILSQPSLSFTGLSLILVLPSVSWMFAFPGFDF